MTVLPPPDEGWFKSSFSPSGGNCVEALLAPFLDPQAAALSQRLQQLIAE
ncbi:hypothetical protein SBI_08100 [Streptomyces bingchenggensis BCW-1]|uniref:DUF397 domain-containing protein n=1 Tax=Streptomyces bingchenggensis (strain BCW-1) TaxID=749414 RepID=D7CI40_STRBB|nr:MULTISPECIES: DUF397 domain-containing protein [Streptomyces]ADI11218.1 hypothetical protein SBI_08100 [Streptomyces bingchenggensis BCW-1]